MGDSPYHPPIFPLKADYVSALSSLQRRASWKVMKIKMYPEHPVDPVKDI